MGDRKERGYLLGYGNRKFIGVVLGYTFALLIAEYLFLAIEVRRWQFYGRNYCMLDCMHVLEKPEYLGVVFMPLALYGIFYGQQVYTHPAFVLKYDSTKSIWNLLYRRLFTRAILFTLVYAVIACILSGLASYDVNNWNEKESMFYGITHTVYSGSTAYVMVMFLLLNVVKICICALVILLVDGLINNRIWGVMPLIVIVVVEWVWTKCTIFFNLFCISQMQFKKPVNVLCLLLAGIALLVILYIAGNKVWKEKEFYEK